MPAGFCAWSTLVWVQFKTVSMRSEKPICAPPCLWEVPPTLPCHKLLFAAGFWWTFPHTHNPPSPPPQKKKTHKTHTLLQQQRPESPTVTLSWHACINTRYVNCTRGTFFIGIKWGLWVCTSGGVYVPCIYTYARWKLPQATQVFVVLVLRISSAN